MKKNSKVMNVLMSLFLVMGMLFQVTPVRADDEYSLNWIVVSDDHDALRITSENVDAVTAIQSSGVITVTDNNEGGPSKTALVVPHSSKYVNGSINEEYPNPGATEGQTSTIRAIVIPWENNLGTILNQKLDPSSEDKCFWDENKDNLIVPVNDTVSLDSGYSFAISGNNINVVSQKLIQASQVSNGISIAWNGNLSDLFYENSSQIIDENNNTITISVSNGEKIYSGNIVTNNSQDVDISNIPDDVSIESCNVNQSNQVVVVIAYRDETSYLTKLLTEGKICFLDNTHTHDGGSVISSLNKDVNPEIVKDSTAKKITITKKIPDGFDSLSLTAEIIVDGFYNLDRNTNKGESTSQDVPSSVKMNDQVIRSAENGVTTFTATIMYGSDGLDYIDKLINNNNVSVQILDDSHSHENAIRIEKSNINLVNDTESRSVTVMCTTTSIVSNSFDLEILVPLYNTLDRNTNKSGGGDDPQGARSVPMNTKIEGVVNNSDTGVQDFVLTCPAMDACKAYLQTVKDSGQLMVEDNSQSNDKKFPNSNQGRDIFVLDLSGNDNKYSLTLNSSYFADDQFNYHAVRGKVTAPGYETLYQGNESNSYPPFTGACTLSFDEVNKNYVVDCGSRPVFSVLDGNTSVALDLSSSKYGTYVNFGQEYEVSQDNKRLTFTNKNLEESGQRIPAGYYSVILSISRMNDRTFPGLKYLLTDSFHFPDINNNEMPENIKIKTWEKKNDNNEEIGTGLELSCTGNSCSAYLTKIYTEADTGMKKGNDYFNKNSGFVLYAEGSPVPHYYPTDKNIFTPIYDSEESENKKIIALRVQPEVLMAEGIPSGTVFVRGSIGVVGWGVTGLSQFNEPNRAGYLTITHGATIVPSDQIQLSQNELSELVVIAPTEFLESVDHIEFDSPTTPKGGALLNSETRTIEHIGDTTSKMTVSIKELYHLYSWIRTGEKTVILSGGGYYGEKKIILNHDYLPMPTDVRISVIGSGLIITNTQENKPEFLREVALGKDRPELGEFNTRINFDTGEMMQDGYAVVLPRSQFNYSFENNNRVLVSANWKQLQNLGAEKNKKYLFQLWDSTYGWANKQDFSLSLNPIILAYAAQHPEEFTYEELEELNRYAITNGEEGLQNVQVNQTVNKTGTSTNVDIAGEVAAAITASDTAGEADIFDLNNEKKEDLTVDVATTISDIPENEVKKMIEAVGDKGTVTSTGVGFDITITKKYTPNDVANWFEKFKRKQGVNTIAELPYPIAIRFPLPNQPLPEGSKYIMLREHKGVVTELDYEIKNGYIIVYSDQFSSFALVTKERADEAVSQPEIGEKPSDVDQKTFNAFVSALTTALHNNAEIIPASKMDVKGEMVDELTEDLPALDEGNKYVVQSYLDIQFDTITDTNVVFNITPMVRVVKMPITVESTTSPNDENVTLAKSGIKLDSLINSSKAVEMLLPVPSSWLEGDSSIFVTHVKDNEKTFIYKGIKDINGVKFTNTHGFSTFSITKGENPAKASVDDTGYTSLQDAIDDVEKNGTVNVSGAGQSAVVSRETTFKIIGDEATLSAGEGYQMIKGENGVYSFIKVTPSKKESSSGSSAPKKDNVVTCQMAGYPANYAWNESVKACQPGYLDNNGVFHLTTGNTNKRVGVVNTSDKGIGGTIATLISSTIAAIAAAYALKKWN